MDYKLSIIGSGTVGGAIGKVFSRAGYEVVFYDKSEKRRGELSSQGYRVVSSPEEAVLSSQISFICVPTPTINGRIETSYMEEALERVISGTKQKEEYHVISIKSTILPWIIEEIMERLEAEAPKRNYGICINPEFLRSETPEEDFLNMPFIIIGGMDEKASHILSSFYSNFRERVRRDFEILNLDTWTASLIKYASNLLLATKISFFNEFQEICKKLDVDTGIIVKYCLSDKFPTHVWYRRDFLREGFRDECLPKDLEAFLGFSRTFFPELSLGILENTRRVNLRKISEGEIV